MPLLTHLHNTWDLCCNGGKKTPKADRFNWVQAQGTFCNLPLTVFSHLFRLIQALPKLNKSRDQEEHVHYLKNWNKPERGVGRRNTSTLCSSHTDKDIDGMAYWFGCQTCKNKYTVRNDTSACLSTAQNWNRFFFSFKTNGIQYIFSGFQNTSLNLRSRGISAK